MLNSILGAIFRARGIPYVQVIQDLYPEILFRTNVIRRASMVGGLLANLQKINLAQAERVIAISPDMADVLHADYNLDRKRIVTIQNWSPISIPRQSTPASTSPNPSGHDSTANKPFILKYSGNLGVGFDCNIVVEIARTLGQRTDFKLVIQGSGRYLWRVRELARAFPCVEVVSRVDAKQVASSLQEADAFLLPTPSHLVGALFPSKIYAYAALGRPVIVSAPPSSYLHTMVKAHEFGFSTLCDSPKAVVDYMILLAKLKADDPAAFEKIANNGRLFTSAVWNRDSAVKKYAELFRELGVATVKGQVLEISQPGPEPESPSSMDGIKKSS